MKMDYLGVSRNEQLSFLRARDPSILSCNFACKKENLRNEFMADIQENEPEDDDKNIQIHLRIKNADMDELYRIDGNEIQCSVLPSHSNKLKNVESVVKKFTFSHIFQPESTQEEIFNLAVKPKLFKFINGENATLMSYGASGSGKTFTIVGTISEPGIIPRTLEYLFRTLPELPEMPEVKPTHSTQVEMLNASQRKEEICAKNNLLSMAISTIDEGHINTYREMQSRLSTEPAGILDDFSTSVSLTVWVSFCEIYNENIHDLLTPIQKQKGNSRTKLKLASHNENTFIKDLTNICVSSGIEAYQILQYGLHNLKYASTSINPHSSRSHCIFTIKIAQVVNGKSLYRLNYFNFCDLAGSERLKKTMNEGDRLRESNNINTSLLVLGRCINCIRENQKRNTKKIIPYRDSKLTRLFQRALSGNESISMIVNINPTTNMFEESLHTLNFSAVAKEVVVKRTPLKIKTKNRFSSYLKAQNLFAANQEDDASEINRMQDLIDKLYVELERQTQYCAEQEVKIREEVCTQQNAIIEEIKENNRQHIAAINDRHKRYIECLKELYESKTTQSDVIDLVSSSDEDDEDNHKQNLYTEINSLKVKLADVQNENILLKNENNLLKNREKAYTQAQEQVDSYKEKIRELEIELTDLKDTYESALQENEQQISLLASENYKLEEENADLTMQIETYTKLMDFQKDDMLP